MPPAFRKGAERGEGELEAGCEGVDGPALRVAPMFRAAMEAEGVVGVAPGLAALTLRLRLRLRLAGIE
jgi:hypothetical protein